MARASYAVIPRSLFDDERFLSLPESAAHLLLRVYGTCDRHGRFPATPLALARRAGFLRADIADDIAAIAGSGLARLYEVDGIKCAELTVLEEVLTARMKDKRGAADFPDPPWSEGAHGGDSGPSEGGASDPQGAPNGPLTGSLTGPLDSQEPEPEPVHTYAGAGAHAREGEPEPRSGAFDPAAGSEPPPLDAESEALVEQLLHAVAQARYTHPTPTPGTKGKSRGPLGGLTLAQVRTELDRTSPLPRQIRDLARSRPEAWRPMARAYLAKHRGKIGTGAEGQPGALPGWLKYLASMVEGWAPDEQPKPPQNGTPAPQESPRRPNVVNPIYAKRLGYVQREDGSWFNEKTGAVFVP